MIQHSVNRQHPRYVSIRCIFIQLGLTDKEVYLLETDNRLSEIQSSTIALSQPVCWTVEQDTEAHDDQVLGQKQRRLCCSWQAGAATYCTIIYPDYSQGCIPPATDAGKETCADPLLTEPEFTTHADKYQRRKASYPAVIK